jgi:hypothetical protein
MPHMATAVAKGRDPIQGHRSLPEDRTVRAMAELCAGRYQLSRTVLDRWNA